MTDKTIVALYDDVADVRRVLDDLEAAGIPRRSFSIKGGETGEAGSSGDRFESLTRLGVPEADAQVYAEGVRRGGVLLVGQVDDADCDPALDIIERHAPADIDERRRLYREAGWAGYDPTAADYDETQASEERDRYRTGLRAAAADMRDANIGRTDVTAGQPGTEETIPLAEENLEIGKRSVERGSVRVRSYVVETPVEEQVRLRDESVTVERRDVDPDRPAGEADFRERTIEVTETGEVPVVSKTSRITEEVVIRKDAQERTETVSDSVRRTEVDIDKSGDKRGAGPEPAPEPGKKGRRERGGA